MAVAAVTFTCHGVAQTKVSLEPAGCPPLNLKPRQHPHHLPWSRFSHAWKIFTFCGSRVCPNAAQGGASPKLGQAQLLPDPLLSLPWDQGEG